MSRQDYSHAARQRSKPVTDTKTVKRTEQMGDGDVIDIRIARVGKERHTIVVTVPRDVEEVLIRREPDVVAERHESGIDPEPKCSERL